MNKSIIAVVFSSRIKPKVENNFPKATPKLSDVLGYPDYMKEVYSEIDVYYDDDQEEECIMFDSKMKLMLYLNRKSLVV